MPFIGATATKEDTAIKALEKSVALPPLSWWGAYFKYTYTPLYSIACRALSVVPSSASVERANSVQLAIHSKARNRLLLSRVDMHISFNRCLERRARRSSSGASGLRWRGPSVLRRALVPPRPRTARRRATAMPTTKEAIRQAMPFRHRRHD
jgi:hypothetical protein